MKVISGSSNPELAKKIASHLGVPMISVDLTQFANKEKRVHIQDEVQGQNLVLVQSFSHPADEHIMEFLLMTDALERLGARHVNLVLPWMGYSLQDKVFRPGEPIAAKVVANLVSNSYTKRVFLLDLHNTSTPGFFSIPSHHLSAQHLFVDYLKEKYDLSKAVIASPDFGGLKRARVLADTLGLGLANIDKHRDFHTGEVTAVDVHGNVDGKIVIILDDVILSGSTAIEAASLLKAKGASQVHFVATHGLFTSGAKEKLQASELDTILITNSIHFENLPPKVTALDCSGLFAEALKTWA